MNTGPGRLPELIIVVVMNIGKRPKLSREWKYLIPLAP